MLNRTDFENVVNETQKLVCSIIYAHVGDMTVVEDLSQETFMKAYAALKDLKDPSKVKPWLCTIARNTAINWRRRTKELGAPSLISESMSSQAGPEREFEKKEIQMHVNRALSELSSDDREILIMRYTGNMSYKEIAAAVGITVAAVGKKLERLGDKLESRLKPVFEG